MPLTLISRRSVVYRESGNGEMTVLLVPARDQILVVKDLAGLGKVEMPVASEARNGKPVRMRKQVQLSRVLVGRRYIYGALPTEVSDLRQPVKVWLAEDFAPAQTQAFFYVFSETVVIHGVREQDDEGQQTWRTAQLLLGEGDPVKNIIDAISDYALANATETLTVAVLNKLDLYEKLQANLSTYNINPVPFSKLKPQAGIKPLYRHHDYTILYLTVALLGVITVCASGAYAFFTKLERDQLQERVEEVRRSIESIKLNQNVGQVVDPQSVLRAMSRGINQQMSAILHAASEAGSQLGSLEKVRVMFEGGDYEGMPIGHVGEGQQIAMVRLTKMKKDLLLDQEVDAAEMVASRPWIREVMRGGNVGDLGVLALTLQVDETAEMKAAATAPLPEAPASTAPVPQALPVEASASQTVVPGAPTQAVAVVASPTQVSATTTVTATEGISASTFQPLVTPTGPLTTPQAGAVAPSAPSPAAKPEAAR